MIDPFNFPQRKQGERIVVTCVISSGDIPITISWEKDNKPIPHNLGIDTKVGFQILFICLCLFVCLSVCLSLSLYIYISLFGIARALSHPLMK